MFYSNALLKSTTRALVLAGIAAATLALSGCATPTGVAFTTEAALATGQAQVYLYRKSALYASTQSFTVKLDQKDVGELFNGSYMQLPLAPGQHVISVKPGALGKTYEHTVQLTDKQTQYLEFEMPAFLLGNAFHLGSSIVPRDVQQAKADLQGLKGVK